MGQHTSAGVSLHFAPSRVEGLADVHEVTIYPDRIEAHGDNESITFRFEDIAKWPRPAWIWKLLHRLGSRRAFLSVADRDWFQASEEKYFAFYTIPQLVVYMPLDSPTDYHESHFRKIQDVMEAGGFRSYDLG